MSSIFNSLCSHEVLHPPFHVVHDLKLALELRLHRLDLLKGNVDDGHHHVDQDHVHHDGEDKEDPRGHL
jgi:hypothetical protein